METILAILAIIVIYGGIALIGAFFSWLGKLNDKRKEKIRNQVLDDLQKEINIKPIINEYKKKLEDINYKKPENETISYINQILQNRNVKLIGEMGNFLGKCPDCKKGQLLARVGKYGNFIGCSEYPKCKHTENVRTAKAQYKQAISEKLMIDIKMAYN